MSLDANVRTVATLIDRIDEHGFPVGDQRVHFHNSWRGMSEVKLGDVRADDIVRRPAQQVQGSLVTKDDSALARADERGDGAATEQSCEWGVVGHDYYSGSRTKT